jgi:hypothetical protein
MFGYYYYQHEHVVASWYVNKQTNQPTNKQTKTKNNGIFFVHIQDLFPKMAGFLLSCLLACLLPSLLACYLACYLFFLIVLLDGWLVFCFLFFLVFFLFVFVAYHLVTDMIWVAFFCMSLSFSSFVFPLLFPTHLFRTGASLFHHPFLSSCINHCFVCHRHGDTILLS